MRVTSHELRVSTCKLKSLKKRATIQKSAISDTRITSSNPRVTTSNLWAMIANPRVQDTSNQWKLK